MWSIPKGEYESGDNALAAAKREFKEETGSPPPDGDYILLGEVKYNNKIITAWAIEGDMHGGEVSSNYFELEWPPHSGKKGQFPEVDRAEWFGLSEAKAKIVKGQSLLIDYLSGKLSLD